MLSNYAIYSTSEEAWQAMYRAIAGAKKSIYWELYIFIDDEAGNPFFDLLEQKAREGLEIKLIVDSLGSFWLSRKRIESLKKSGVDILFFNGKVTLKDWWKTIWTRTHRKILVVDDAVGFIGGVNISKQMKDWLDVQVRLEGQIIYSLLRSFHKAYIRAGGSPERIEHLSRRKLGKWSRIRSRREEFIYGDALPFQSRIRDRYTEAFRKAKERIILFTPYYFPDRYFLRELWDARARGVRVDLLIPFRSDVRLATYAGYSLFSVMRKIGVNIHLVKKMMHGKGMIVDDRYAIVGSSNLDQTSFYDNYEANVKIKDRAFVRQLKKVIDGWRTHSMLFDDIKWKRRGWWWQCKERLTAFILAWWHRSRDVER